MGESQSKQGKTADCIRFYLTISLSTFLVITLIFRKQNIIRNVDGVNLKSVLYGSEPSWILNNNQFCQLQVKCLCVLMFLSFPLSMAEVPGPCRHSITREHLLIVRQLVGVKTTSNRSDQISLAEILPLLFLQMDNQLRSGCSITYTFIERRTLVRKCLSKKVFLYKRWTVKYSCLLLLIFSSFFPEQMLLCESCFTLDTGAAYHQLQVQSGLNKWWLCSVPEGTHSQHVFAKMRASD